MMIGCKYARTVINVLVFADDMVIVTPSWFALQTLLIAVEVEANKINVTFNTKKTICVVF